MRAFFAGWRRKVGLVTLVIAMVFMGGWLRCFVVDDFELVDFDEWVWRLPINRCVSIDTISTAFKICR
jgi:NADH:ubiquinone oxidoreductase subunit H